MDLTGYGRHEIDSDDIAAVIRVLEGDALTTGPTVAAFEAAFCDATAAPETVACSNGTAALHLAAWGLGIGPGDAVIVPSVTFLATANAMRLAGAEVVFADVDPETGLMTTETLAAAAELATRKGCKIAAIAPVHLNGQAADMVELAAFARQRGWRVIEDGCHALGTRHAADAAEGGATVGDARLSDAVCFSFHPVKTIAMGEGGAVTTRDAGLAQRMRRLRSHGMVRDANGFKVREAAFDTDGAANPWYYEMSEIGHNFRVSDINCALGLSQLAKLDTFVARRAELVAAYDEALAGMADIVTPVGTAQRGLAAWHIYAVQIDFDRQGRTRAAVMRALAERAIGTQVHYIPVHRQPYYRARYGEATLPGADLYYRRALTLPLFPAMDAADVERVVGALGECLA